MNLEECAMARNTLGKMTNFLIVLTGLFLAVAPAHAWLVAGHKTHLTQGVKDATRWPCISVAKILPALC